MRTAGSSREAVAAAVEVEKENAFVVARSSATWVAVCEARRSDVHVAVRSRLDH